MNTFIQSKKLLFPILCVLMITSCSETYPEGLYVYDKSGKNLLDEESKNAGTLLSELTGFVMDVVNPDLYYILVESDSLHFVSRVNRASNFESVTSNNIKSIYFAEADRDASLQIENGGLLFKTKKHSMMFSKSSNIEKDLKNIKEIKTSFKDKMKILSSLNGPEQTCLELFKALVKLDMRTISELTTEGSQAYVVGFALFLNKEYRALTKVAGTITELTEFQGAISRIFDCTVSDNGTAICYMSLDNGVPKPETGLPLSFKIENGIYKLDIENQIVELINTQDNK